MFSRGARRAAAIAARIAVARVGASRGGSAALARRVAAARRVATGSSGIAVWVLARVTMPHGGRETMRRQEEATFAHLRGSDRRFLVPPATGAATGSLTAYDPSPPRFPKIVDHDAVASLHPESAATRGERKTVFGFTPRIGLPFVVDMPKDLIGDCARESTQENSAPVNARPARADKASERNCTREPQNAALQPLQQCEL